MLEKFWLNDIKGFFAKKRYLKFFPKCDGSMTKIEQLNAVTRLCIYFIILILIFDKDSNYNLLCLPIAVITVGVVYFNLTKHNFKKNKYRGLKNKDLINKDKEKEKVNFVAADNSKMSTPKMASPKAITQHKDRYYNDLESLYTTDEVYNCEETCKRPTYDNPMMNPDVTEFNIPDPPAACNADDEDINDSQELHFSPNLFMSTGDVFEKENKSRQFYSTLNNSVPNQQIEFTKWLLSGPSTGNCKTDQSQCFRQTELRRNNGQLNPY